MDFFSDRRDISKSGLKRRELFGKLMEVLTSKGMADHVARDELLKVLRGKGSAVLEKYGINTRIK
jgi:hypothetical protein